MDYAADIAWYGRCIYVMGLCDDPLRDDQLGAALVDEGADLAVDAAVGDERIDLVQRGEGRGGEGAMRT